MKHILVVDDSKQYLLLARAALSGEFEVTPVTSGEQALKFLEKRRPDLILLDLLMPEMDGRETLEKIRANSDWATIPVIFLTADDEPGTKEQCLRDGAVDYVVKPFVPQDMKNRIYAVLG